MIKRCLIILICIFPLILKAAPLPVNEAFKISTKPIDPNTIEIKLVMANNYFLYKDCLQIINTKDSDIQIGNITYPVPEEKINRQGQRFPVYQNKLLLTIPLLSEKPGENLIEIRYQGCSDEGFCYPPERKWIKISTNTKLEITTTTIEQIPENLSEPTTKPIKNTVKTETVKNNFHNILSSKNWFLIIISFLGFGLLLSFTPCVLPMVPVLSSIIVGHGHNISTKKAFLLSLSYVISMSVTYGIIGAIIATLGSNLQILMQSPWAISIFSIIFILLALSMFDFYELKLPLSWQNNLAKITRNQAGGHYLSTVILGSMSILILSPCVSAPLIGVLGYIAQTGDVLLGVLSLFFLSFGMGIPLLLIGTSAGKLLPKAGVWMNTVKNMFGVILIAVAIYLMSRLLPATISMLLWSSLCIFTGIYLKPFHNAKTNQAKIKQGFAILFLGYGLLILYGASAGHKNPLLPLKSEHEYQEITKFKTQTIIVDNIKETLDVLEKAKQDSTPVMIYFYADWCASCHVISSTTLKNEAVLKELEHILLLKVDLTKNNSNTKVLLNYFNVIAPPTFIFYNKDGQTLSEQLVGDISPATLITQLEKLL